MKRNSWIAVAILAVLVVVTFFYQPPAASLMQLPDEGRQLVLMLVTAAVTWALLQLSLAIGIDLGGYAGPIAAVLSPLIITLIENYLQLIPAIYDDIVLWVIHLLVLLLGSLGAYLITNRIRRKETKALLA